MAKVKPQASINPVGAGVVSDIETYTDEYWYGTVYHWDFTATPNPGYDFVYWDYYEIDGYGNTTHGTSALSTFGVHWGSSLTEYRSDWGVTSLVANFKASTPPASDSAINLSLVSNPVGFGTLTGGGLKSGPVGSSVSFDVAAAVAAARQGTHRFSHWIDDEGVKYKTKQFSKTFTLKSGYTTSNPEQKTFTAYFVPYTNLILRSANSGLILRGSNDKILRDE